jgi:hypothetical protein
MDPFIGSSEHKELLCRFFIDTHVPFEPRDLTWPRLDDAVRARLASLPLWSEAAKIEALTALVVSTMAKEEKDVALAEAIRLQGYEEARHAEMLALLAKCCDILVPPHTVTPPTDARWAFMRVGYGECFDSFFAFGLFALARDSGFFPAELVRLFDPVMQEESRHIIFHVNWVAYQQAQAGIAHRPAHLWRRGMATCVQMFSRLKTALAVRSSGGGSEQHFTMNAHQALGAISPRAFVKLCLEENERRLAPYDGRLLRPTLVPALARASLRLWGGSAPSCDILPGGY